MANVALELGSNSSRNAWQRCFLGTAGHAMVCSDLSLSLLFGNDLLSGGQVMKLGPAVCAGWVERDWGCGPCCWA